MNIAEHKNPNDEALKELIDDFGKLSFLLETAVKLHQVGHCNHIKRQCLIECHELANNLVVKFDEITNE